MRWWRLAFILLALASGALWFSLHHPGATEISATLPVAAPKAADISGAVSGIAERNTARPLPPIAGFAERVTKKPFGIFITPETSPVQPDRFLGYHTGIDVEYDGVSNEIPVSAIADGTVIFSRFASGYGGVIVIRHAIGGGPLLALYGHLDPKTLTATGTNIRRGETIGVLGKGYSEETDGVRKHLHFALLKKNTVDLRGYVKTPEELAGWYNPLDFY